MYFVLFVVLVCLFSLSGRGGRSVTFVTQYDIDRVHAIEERIGTSRLSVRC